MARKPLIVAVSCDRCDEEIILHGRGDEITVDWLNKHLTSIGWSRPQSSDTGLQFDACPACTKVDKSEMGR